MLSKLGTWWTWFVEGLVEALLWGLDRARRAAPVRIEFGGPEVAVLGADGARLGRLTPGDGPALFEPADLPRRLAGAAVDVVVPAAWIARRELDPVALASRPFLDAFVRHQIERVTPWRVGDTHYRILDRPMPDDPARLAVAVAVMPKRLVARALAAVEPLHPKGVRLRGADDPAGAAAISIGGGRSHQAAALRRGVVGGLGALALAAVALVGVLQWQGAQVRDDIDEQDRVLDGRKAVLARERRAADPGGAAAGKLRALREARPSAVAVIDALSAALPDSAHLTALSIDGDHVTVAGVSGEPSALVPALETSGDFAAVAFGAATTRAEAGGGDRFTLEMKALPPRSDHAGPPQGDAASPVARAAP
ncbi:hypothetical protein D3273_10025 [Lichenibacterium minor]|uniref:Fimbrial assembly protein n=1 Tax=Lichenibacterium minor TaxID=2316528 RepID=A0A4Q2U6U8_9HYPH|nr:PilN domain-containing protein [Lichenibacterium minor]RYC32062.1 hypothetical protein D3273_10025 [Lichenibacterium minor]